MLYKMECKDITFMSNIQPPFKRKKVKVLIVFCENRVIMRREIVVVRNIEMLKKQNMFGVCYFFYNFALKFDLICHNMSTNDTSLSASKTPIAELGEFGLIKRLTQDIKLQQPSSIKGVGDDAAVLDFTKHGQEMQTLVTSDLLLEGIHFNLEYVPLKHLGYKAAVVNFSDIYAMNGTPTQIIVSLGISKRFSVEDVQALYDGIRLACEHYHVDIVGGDTTSSMTGLTISITCMGVAGKDEVVYRNGAKVNDLICVTGNLGAAYLGLQLLERERIVMQANAKATPAFEGKEYLLERQLKPQARVDIIQQLKQAGIKPTAMMDISDGLSSELMHICKQSGVGCAIYEDKLPIDYQSAVLAEEMNMSIVTCALNGGEDYELLFTCSLDDYEKLIPIDDLYLVGHITKPEYGTMLIGRNGEELSLQAQGWQAFKEN